METGANVVVSVDAASHETMKALGRGDFAKLIRSLAYGAAERARSGDKGEIAFNAVMTSVNLGELVGILRLAAQFKVSRVTLFPVVTSRDNPLHLDHRKLDLRPCIADAESAAKELGIELRIGASLHEELVVSDALPDRCSHPWEYCYIDYAGNVGYCDHLIGHSGLMLGSLSSSSFEEIWNGAGFQDLRRYHMQARRGSPGQLATTHPHCAWCYERRYVDFEDETNPAARTRTVSTAGTLPLVGCPPGPFSRSNFMGGRKLS